MRPTSAFAAPRSAEAAEPRDELFRRNAFFSVGLVEGGEKFSFFLGRESDNRFIAAREDGYGRSLRQRESLDNNLAVNDGARSDLRGSMKGLSTLREGPMQADAAVQAWRQEYAARDWIIGWLDTHSQYAMTLDMPLWAASSFGANSPFHHCSTAQLIDMTVQNLRLIERIANGRAKWLNVVQGGETTTDIQVWWDAVKWFKRGGWALAGSAGCRGGLGNVLRTLLMMRDDGAFDAGQDWVHVLGVSTPAWAVLLSAIQRALRRFNPSLRVSFDSSNPFQIGGRYEHIALTPKLTSDPRTWAIKTMLAPQSRLHADPSAPLSFPHAQSPIGRQLKLHHLSVRGGLWFFATTGERCWNSRPSSDNLKR